MMCCGTEDSVEFGSDVKRLITSVLRKKRTNRVRKHPSMCVDAVLASTLLLIKNQELRAVNETRCRKRPSTPNKRPAKRSRWDQKSKRTENYEVDDELENLLVLINDF